MADAATRPLVGWDLHSAAGKAIVLNLQTVGDDVERQAVIDGVSPPLNLKAVMTPEQCMALSEELIRQALTLMAQRPIHPF